MPATQFSFSPSVWKTGERQSTDRIFHNSVYHRDCHHPFHSLPPDDIHPHNLSIACTPLPQRRNHHLVRYLPNSNKNKIHPHFLYHNNRKILVSRPPESPFILLEDSCPDTNFSSCQNTLQNLISLDINLYSLCSFSTDNRVSVSLFRAVKVKAAYSTTEAAEYAAFMVDRPALP